MNEASGSQLTVPGFAEVTADRLTVRQEPGLSGEPLMDHIGCIDNPDPNCAQPILIGTATGYVDLYVVDGPVEVDGYEWYLATSHRLEMLGWVAGGDGVDAWLVSASRSCPSHPVELADVTVQATTSAELLHCFGQDELTVRGWYPDLPPGEQETNVGLEDCRAERGWLFCYSIFDMLRPEPGPWAGSADYLAFAVDPAAGVTMPGRSQWVEVTGSWEHPASATCGDIAAVLKCRGTFVVSAAHVP